jgi:NAD(P)H-dependent FMN reductase
MLRVCIISGSHRSQSNSAKIAKFIEKRFYALSGEVETDIVDLHAEKIPMWDEGIFQKDSPFNQVWQPISARLKKADAFVILSPEWGGMVTPGLKSFLLCCNDGELSHKPAMIGAVSAGQGGAYPISELRSSGYKNNQVVFVPDHLIFRDATHLFNDEKPANDFDVYMRTRLDYAINVLMQYGHALKQVRESGCVDVKKYPYGM